MIFHGKSFNTKSIGGTKRCSIHEMLNLGPGGSESRRQKNSLEFSVSFLQNLGRLF